MWHVMVDPEVCEANAVCTSIAPSVFVLDDNETVARVVQGEVTEENVEVVRRAARQCPKQAIRVVEAGAVERP